MCLPLTCWSHCLRLFLAAEVEAEANGPSAPRVLFLQIDAVAGRLTVSGEPRAQVRVERNLWPASQEDVTRNRGDQDDECVCSICLDSIEPQGCGEKVCKLAPVCTETPSIYGFTCGAR